MIGKILIRLILFSSVIMIFMTGEAWSQSNVKQQDVNWVYLRSFEANLRAGPGNNFAVIAVYRNKYMPLKVIRDYRNWVHVVDIDGMKGWINRKVVFNSTKNYLAIKRNSYLYNTTKLKKKRATMHKYLVVISKGVQSKLGAKSSCNITTVFSNYSGWTLCNNLWGNR